MLGWELPPHNSGGLGVACYQLCKALSKKGADIEFVLPYTASHPGIDFMKISSAHPQDAETVMKAGMAYDSFKYVKKTGEIKYMAKPRFTKRQSVGSLTWVPSISSTPTTGLLAALHCAPR